MWKVFVCRHNSQRIMNKWMYGHWRYITLHNILSLHNILIILDIIELYSKVLKSLFSCKTMIPVIINSNIVRCLNSPKIYLKTSQEPHDIIHSFEIFPIYTKYFLKDAEISSNKTILKNNHLTIFICVNKHFSGLSDIVLQKLITLNVTLLFCDIVSTLLFYNIIMLLIFI